MGSCSFIYISHFVPDVHCLCCCAVVLFPVAGKALDERKAEIRIQFKEAPGSQFIFAGQDAPCNELVMRLQPDQAVYFKVDYHRT